jgi:kumamolisin
VLGLVHLNLNKTMLIRPGNGNYFGMSVPQLRRAFDFTGASSKGFTGTGITVGIIGTGPISSADVPLLAKLDNVPAPPAINVVAALPQPASTLNNNTGTGTYDDTTGLATPPPVTAPCDQLGTSIVSANCNPEDGEAQLDTEQLALLAPGATVNFYLAYNTNDCAAVGAPSGCLGVEGLFVSDDEIQQAIADNAVDALSLSYGFPEAAAVGFYYDSSGAGIGPAEFAALKSEGIAVFVSSGDNGAHDCTDRSSGAPTAQFCADYPATDPSVVAVGGVNYPMDSYGNLPPGAQITAWAANSTLGGDGVADNSAGSGGGISGVFAAPQSQSGLPATVQGVATGGKRTIPDISMMGDPLTGVQFVMNAAYPSQAGIGAVGGTSVAAPEMTAAWAIVLQACKLDAKCSTAAGAHPWRLGDPKPLLYQIYGSASQYGSTIYDVLAGNNGDFSDPCLLGPCATPTPGQFIPGYNAGKGYDLVTGLGVPFLGHLLDTVVTAAGGTSPNAP